MLNNFFQPLFCNYWIVFSFSAMNKGNIQDSEMENIIDSTVDGLFSAFATLGV